MGRNAHMARRKMSHVIDELYTALFQLGGAAVDFQLRRETEGLRLSVRGEFSPENRREVERMAQTLQPAVRNPALVETYWELAGGDPYSGDSELALVGHMLDEASVRLGEGTVALDLLICS